MSRVDWKNTLSLTALESYYGYDKYLLAALGFVWSYIILIKRIYILKFSVGFKFACKV